MIIVIFESFLRQAFYLGLFTVLERTVNFQHTAEPRDNRPAFKGSPSINVNTLNDSLNDSLNSLNDNLNDSF